MTQRFQEVMEISESTLYPVLRRLQKADYLSTYDQPFEGRNRRYYTITEAGKEMLSFYRSEWTNYKNGVENLLGGEIRNENRNAY